MEETFELDLTSNDYSPLENEYNGSNAHSIYSNRNLIEHKIAMPSQDCNAFTRLQCNLIGGVYDNYWNACDSVTKEKTNN